jgi:lantibiotic modifying enzyme
MMLEPTLINESRDRDVVLDAAIKIGEKLCETAFWNVGEVECNWMAPGVTGSSVHGGSTNCLALGPDLYAGSTGIALALADLYVQTGSEAFGRTAIGALLRSIRHLRDFSTTSSPLSFHGGQLGVAYAAKRIMFQLHNDKFHKDIESLLQEVPAAIERHHHLDFAGGNAGAIPILIAFSQFPKYRHLFDLALRCGDELCTLANWTGECCSWNASQATGLDFPTPLAGFAHGTAGIALALLELYKETGTKKYVDTARGALAYEDTLYSESENNWLDVRFPHNREGGTLSGSFPTAWCHGAPGIALARVRARKLDAEYGQSYEKSFRTALQTTITAADRLLRLSRSDASLCHGIIGLSEVILICSEFLSDNEYNSISVNIATKTAEKYIRSGDWPCGIGADALHPSLMLGIAGIAHHFMRIYSCGQVQPLLVASSRFNISS